MAAARVSGRQNAPQSILGGASWRAAFHAAERRRELCPSPYHTGSCSSGCCVATLQCRAQSANVGLQSRKAHRSTCKLRYEPPRVGSVAAVRLMAAPACRRAPDQRGPVSSSGAAPGAAATPAGLQSVPSAAAMRVGRVRAVQGGFRDRADCDGPGLLTENRNCGSRGSFRCLEALLPCTRRSHADHGRPRTGSRCT